LLQNNTKTEASEHHTIDLNWRALTYFSAAHNNSTTNTGSAPWPNATKEVKTEKFSIREMRITALLGRGKRALYKCP